MRYLVAIEQTGNLSRAADELHVTQPALSYAVRRLERELGVRIFARHTGGMWLTTAKRDVLSAAKRVVHEADHLVELAAAHSEGQRGVLRIGFEASRAGELTTLVYAFGTVEPCGATKFRLQR